MKSSSNLMQVSARMKECTAVGPGCGVVASPCGIRTAKTFNRLIEELVRETSSDLVKNKSNTLKSQLSKYG